VALKPDIGEAKGPQYDVARAINSFLGQGVQGYIDTLSSKLAADGYGHHLLIMQANDGLTRKEELQPIATLSSGPAGGGRPRPPRRC